MEWEFNRLRMVFYRRKVVLGDLQAGTVPIVEKERAQNKN